MPRAYYSIFLGEQQALVWQADVCFAPLYFSPGSGECKIPKIPRKAFVLLTSVYVCVYRAVRGREAGERAAVDILWDNERKTTKSKKEKAAKAGEGTSQGVERPEEDWILTACGELSIPHTDVHNHHPRQLLIIIITAVATGRIRREWLIEG